jgi:hypothetical protein
VLTLAVDRPASGLRVVLQGGWAGAVSAGQEFRLRSCTHITAACVSRYAQRLICGCSITGSPSGASVGFPRCGQIPRTNLGVTLADMLTTAAIFGGLSVLGRLCLEECHTPFTASLRMSLHWRKSSAARSQYQLLSIWERICFIQGIVVSASYDTTCRDQCNKNLLTTKSLLAPRSTGGNSCALPEKAG